MTNDIASELKKLHILTGAEFSRLVESIAQMHIFQPIDNEIGIFGTGNYKDKDYLR